MNLFVNTFCGNNDDVVPYTPQQSPIRNNTSIFATFPTDLVKIIGDYYSTSYNLFHQIMATVVQIDQPAINFFKIISKEESSLNLENYPITPHNLRDALFFYPNLKNFNISCSNLNAKQILWLRDFTSMETLVLTDCGKITDTIVLQNTLLELPNTMPNLSVFTVQGVYPVPSSFSDLLGTHDILVQTRIEYINVIATKIFTQHKQLNNFTFEEQIFSRRRPHS